MKKSVLEVIYGQQASKIHNLSILLVGVGGIGCQVLKCLSKLPIKNLHILDLDTIEISNLNRQFLFQSKHRNQSKALTAKESMLAINPNINITAHHANIKQMEARFFMQFNLVIMALDNAEARSFVNEVCVLLGIPIVDAGTSGYNGQVHFIIPGKTSCFDCQPKTADNKVFQVCTIRTRPDKPIHCITWAKFLFQALFGPQDEGNLINDMAKLGNELKKDSSIQRINQFVQQIFRTDIKSLITDKSKPITQITQQDLDLFQPLAISSLSQSMFTNIQSVLFHINSFKTSLIILLKLAQTQQFLTFQKDDPVIMSFISSASNLRMHIFNIPLMSFYSIKETAGNIIPAIASTNSIVAGLEITESIKYILENYDSLRSIYLKSWKQKLSPMRPEKPNIECKVCSTNQKPIIIEANFEKRLTLQYLTDIIKSNRPELDFSINIKIGSNDKRQLLQLMNKADYEDGLLEKKYMENSIANFQRQKKIANCFILNEDNGNFVCHMYLLDNSEFDGDKEVLDLRGLFNVEISQNLGDDPEEEDMEQEMDEKKGEKQIVIEDSQESDDSLCIIEQPKVVQLQVEDEQKTSKNSIKKRNGQNDIPEGRTKRMKLD